MLMLSAEKCYLEHGCDDHLANQEPVSSQLTKWGFYICRMKGLIGGRLWEEGGGVLHVYVCVRVCVYVVV